MDVASILCGVGFILFMGYLIRKLKWLNKLSKKCFLYIFLLNMRKKTLNWIYDESFFWFLEKKYFEKSQNFILRKNIVYDVFMVYTLIDFEKVFL